MKKLKYALLLGLVSLTTTSFADGLSALNNFNQNAKSLSGNFSQSVKSAKQTRKTNGTFAISRPNQFKWTYSKPYQQIIVGDGSSIWLYDIDLAQVTKRSQQKTLGDSPAAILSNAGALESSYTISNDGENGGISYVKALPKKKDSGYEYIRIGFKDDTLANMTLKDSFGNTTTLTFSNIKLNSSIPAGTFKFSPPKGVDVLTE